VDRPRLTRRILDAPGVVVLSAPAGYGATTALAVALRIQPLPVVWVSADGAGDSMAAVWAALGSALGRSGPGPATPDDVLDRLHSGPARWLVLDGLDPRVPDGTVAVGHLVRHLPERVRLAITTVSGLGALDLGRPSELTVIDEHELAMTDAESAEVLLGRAPGMDIEQVEAVIGECEGWPLALAAAAGRAVQHPGEDVAAWLHSEGADLLVQPWWRTLTEPQRLLLASTAFLDRLHGGLVGAVLESRDAERDLAALTSLKGHLHPVAHEADGVWWRRSILLDLLLAHGTPSASGEDYSRAADWLQRSGRIDEALGYLRAAGRNDEVARLLRLQEDEWLSRGEPARALSAYRGAAPDQALPRIVHCLRLGWAHSVAGDRRAAEAYLEEILTLHATATRPSGSGEPAEPGWRSEPSLEDTNLEGEVRLFQAQLAGLSGDAAGMVAAARSAVDAFGGSTERTSHQLAPILLARGHVWGGNVAAARMAVQQFAQRAVGNDALREAMLSALNAELLIAEGRVYEGRVFSDRAMSWFDRTGADPATIGDLTPLLSHVAALTEGGSPSRAVEVAMTVIAACEPGGLTGPMVRALTLLARAEQARGNLPAALGAIGRARRELRASAPRSTMVIPLDIVEIGIRLAGGDPLRAERLARQLPAGESRTLLTAQVTVRRHAQRPVRILADFVGSTPRSEAARHVITGAAELRRSSRLAEAHLIKAADIAIEEGMALLLAGSSAELLAFAEATARRVSHDGLAALAASALNRSEPGSAARAVNDLSRGEIELLAFLPGRDTNAEIAHQLGITVNTVKTRMQRLYRKLGVGSRNEAVRVARARNLLPRGGGTGRVAP
jgi:LuxR family maltose regulon positive regulatory protein